MQFDIYERVVDENGEYLEDRALRYRDRLMEIFFVSNEGRQLGDQGATLGWAEMFMDLGMSYLGLTPPQMRPQDAAEVVFGLIPRKISTEPESAGEIVRELRAFWSFLGRKFALPNALVCSGVFNEKAERTLQRELANPANFGMAKSLLMMGKERGFDMETEEGINTWFATYNAEQQARMAANPNAPPLLPGIMPGIMPGMMSRIMPESVSGYLSDSPTPASSGSHRTKKPTTARKHKAARESRQKNRRT